MYIMYVVRGNIYKKTQYIMYSARPINMYICQFFFLFFSKVSSICIVYFAGTIIHSIRIRVSTCLC